jgi:hypothetical protein
VDVSAPREVALVAATPGLTGSFNSGGCGGTNEAESQPAKITDTASMVPIAVTPTLFRLIGQVNAVVVFKVMVLRLFVRDRWVRGRGTRN